MRMTCALLLPLAVARLWHMLCLSSMDWQGELVASGSSWWLRSGARALTVHGFDMAVLSHDRHAPPVMGSASSDCLQALMVLPTRDLAAQVFRVVKPLCDAVGLSCGLAAAQASTAAEEAQLLGRVLAAPQLESQLLISQPRVVQRHSGQPTPSPESRSRRTHRRGQHQPQAPASTLPHPTSPQTQHPMEGVSASGVGTPEAREMERSCVQVLVATPGRLVSHMTGTPGFTLRHLRFLVSGVVDGCVGGLRIP